MPKKLIKKGRKTDNNPNEFGCNVPLHVIKKYKLKHPLIKGNRKPQGHCNRNVHLGWEVGGVGGRVCWECWCWHTDHECGFTLHEAFGVVTPDRVGVPLDRFGFEKARDEEELKIELEKPEREVKPLKKKVAFKRNVVKEVNDDNASDLLGDFF